MKDWQRGTEIDVLKKHAAYFKEAQGPFCFADLSLVNPMNLAEAIAEGHFAHSDGAAAIYRRVKSASHHETYHESKVVLQAGDGFISSFAVTKKYDGKTLLAELVAKLSKSEEGGWFAKSPRVWLEIFEEDEQAKSIAESLGFRYIDSKVKAYSEIKGLYVYGDPTEPAFNDAAEAQTLAILQPNWLSADDLADIQQELRDYGDKWAQHYSMYNKEKSWTAFSLWGYDEQDPTFIIRPDEMGRKWISKNPERMSATLRPTIAAQHFPKSLAIAQRIPNAGFDRIRFMRLSPGGGELGRHQDNCPAAGVKDGRLARIHIPIVTNDGVVFEQWNHRGRHIEKRFPEAALCYIDQRQPHKAVNGGTTDRIHFVLDAKSNGDLRKLIASGK